MRSRQGLQPLVDGVLHPASLAWFASASGPGATRILARWTRMSVGQKDLQRRKGARVQPSSLDKQVADHRIALACLDRSDRLLELGKSRCDGRGASAGDMGKS
jgi:hypothetical protein